MRMVTVVAALVLGGLPVIAHADQKGGGTVITGPLDCEHEQERVLKCETKGDPPQRVCNWVWVDKGCAVYIQKQPTPTGGGLKLKSN